MAEAEVKKIELEMLKYFIDICNKFKLRYFLMGGTALGAVRHKGFIPWDDDIDVGMPREDYNKFIQIAQNELPKHIFLQTNKTDNECLINFAKLRNCNSTFIEISSKNLNINHGIYIDIFPIDGISNNFIKNKIFRLKQIIYIHRISQQYYNEDSTKVKLKWKILKLITKNIYKDPKILRDRLDESYQKYSYEESNRVVNYCGAWGIKEEVPKEYYGKGIKGEFEGVEVILPEKYHEYLNQIYGDYMTLPPKEKQISHHYCTVIDTENSYKNYINF